MKAFISRSIAWLSFPLAVIFFMASPLHAGEVYLSDMEWEYAVNGFGPVERDISNGGQLKNDGGPITIDGVEYKKGLGVHAFSAVRCRLDGQYSRFKAEVGLDDMHGPKLIPQGDVVFEVWVDGIKQFSSGIMRHGDRAQSIDIDVTDARFLELVCNPARAYPIVFLKFREYTRDAAGNWAGARLVYSGSTRPANTKPAPLPRPPYIEKPRLIITTDMGPAYIEPDDLQSLVRVLLYSNEVDIEGIIMNTGEWARMIDQGKKKRTWRVIDAYGKVRDNLLVHASGYPSAEYLKSLVKDGQPRYNMKGVGDNKSTEGSGHIISVIDKKDDRPVWIINWGGTNTIAQALWDVRSSRSPDEVRRFVDKIRVFDIDGQDNSGAWMCHEFPNLYYIRSNNQFWGFSRLFNNAGDNSLVSRRWAAESVISKGPLGAVYPAHMWGMETDSPSFYFTLTNGLTNNPESTDYGNFGGRYSSQKVINVPPIYGQIRLEGEEDDYMPFYMFSEVPDTWRREEMDTTLHYDVYAPVGRWRYAYQNEMAARMDWTVKDSFHEANHNPLAVINGDTSKQVIYLEVDPGDEVTLDASASSDPDGDNLFFKWFVYPEPSTYKNSVSLDGGNKEVRSFIMPHDIDFGEEIHIVLEVKDDGIAFPLYSYRRVVVSRPFVYLSDLSWTKSANGRGCIEKDMSNGGDEKGGGDIISISGIKYYKGLGCYSDSEIVYNLGGKYARLIAAVGLDDDSDHMRKGGAVFEVWADNKIIFSSGPMFHADRAKRLDVDITGVDELRLAVRNHDGDASAVSASWAEARIYYNPMKKERPPE